MVALLCRGIDQYYRCFCEDPCDVEVAERAHFAWSSVVKFFQSPCDSASFHLVSLFSGPVHVAQHCAGNIEHEGVSLVELAGHDVVELLVELEAKLRFEVGLKGQVVEA